MPPSDSHPIALAFIIIGALLGFGREFLAKFYVKLAERLRGAPADARLLSVFRLYLVFTSMIFGVAGLLGLLGVLKM